jgi:hypothetical protein
MQADSEHVQIIHISAGESVTVTARKRAVKKASKKKASKKKASKKKASKKKASKKKASKSEAVRSREAKELYQRVNKEIPLSTTAQVVLDTIKKGATSYNGYTRLADLRPQLVMSFAKQDKALKELAAADEITLYRDDDNAALTQADKDAALFYPDGPRHLLYLT